MIHSETVVTELAIDFIYQFYMVTFGDTSSNSCFYNLITTLCALFPCVSFCWALMDGKNRNSHFCAQVTEKMQVECNHFCH